MRPMLDPERDLKGATPEKLARALLRPLGPRPRARKLAMDSEGLEPSGSRMEGSSLHHTEPNAPKSRGIEHGPPAP